MVRLKWGQYSASTAYCPPSVIKVIKLLSMVKQYFTNVNCKHKIELDIYLDFKLKGFELKKPGRRPKAKTALISKSMTV